MGAWVEFITALKVSDVGGNPSGLGMVVKADANSGLIAASFGGGANSVATLNASSLVVQNPANISDTGLDNKIPMGITGDELDPSWMSSLAVVALEINKTYSDFSDSGATKTVTLLATSSKGRTVVHAVRASLTTTFAAPSLVSAVVEVGESSGQACKFCPAFNLMQAVDTGSWALANSGGAKSGSAGFITATVTITGDTLDNLTAGAFTLYLYTSVLPL